MTKRYFSKRPKSKHPSLKKILVTLFVVSGVGYVALHLQQRGGIAGWQEPAEAAISSVLASGQDLAAQEQWDELSALLEPTLAGLQSGAPDFFALQALAADAEFHRGLTGESAARYAELVRQFPNHPEQPGTTLKLARATIAKGDRAEGLDLLSALREKAPPEVRAGVLLELGRDALHNSEKLAARDLLKLGLQDAAEGSPDWDGLIDAYGDANVAMIFSPEEAPESRYYTIESGDNLTRIGVKLNTTQGLLMRANNLTNEATIHPGQRLKHTPKDFQIIIERSTCRLYLMDKDGLFKRYTVGLGKPGYETALGAYHIGNKEKDPTWFKPGSEPIPPGDPENELGTRWMPLVPMEEGLPNDLGIHGTIEPDSIGRYTSRGCPRLQKEEVEELYDLVVRSTPVLIVDVLLDAHKAAIRGSIQ